MQNAPQLAATRKADSNSGLLSLQGVYELASRPSSVREKEVSQAVWDAQGQMAIVETPKGKHVQVMGRWAAINRGETTTTDDAAAPAKKLVLEPEETLLLVQWGLLILRLEGSAKTLSVAEVHEVVFACNGVSPSFCSAYSHLRDLGFGVLRHPGSHQEGETSGVGRHPPLRVWTPERTGKKGWRQAVPDFVLLTFDSEEALPLPSSLEELQSSLQEVALRAAVADRTSGLIFLDLSFTSPLPG